MTFALGELKNRIDKNRARLQAEAYTSPEIFENGGDWDGDWQGRTMLALCCHYHLVSDAKTKQAVLSQLKNIIDALTFHTNKDGYFGEVFDSITCNEQQLSGNSWFLRGLCEYYNISSDENIKARLSLISSHYLCKLAPFYKNYPLVEREEGGVGGHLLRVKVNGWYLSSDIACAYILLDGITALYEIVPSAALKDVITIMIENFICIDFEAKNCQTHATLSGARGVLRFMKHYDGDCDLKKSVEDIFDLYYNKGMTVNYANFNWFGRPYWTEPCAVVDSIMVAQQLYKMTEKPLYLQFVNRAYLNAIRMCQRINGGAGCETCLNETNSIIKMHLYEADFCCTMRLAEGLKNLSDFACLKKENEVIISMLSSFEHTSDMFKMRVSYQSFGANGKMEINMRDCISSGTIKVYLPKGAKVTSNTNIAIADCFVIVPYRQDGKIVLEFVFNHYVEQLKGHAVHMLGDCILTEKCFHYKTDFSLQIEGRTLSPMLNFMETEETFLANNIIQKI